MKHVSSNEPLFSDSCIQRFLIGTVAPPGTNWGAEGQRGNVATVNLPMLLAQHSRVQVAKWMFCTGGHSRKFSANILCGKAGGPRQARKLFGTHRRNFADSGQNRENPRKALSISNIRAGRSKFAIPKPKGAAISVTHAPPMRFASPGRCFDGYDHARVWLGDAAPASEELNRFNSPALWNQLLSAIVYNFMKYRGLRQMAPPDPARRAHKAQL